MPPPVETECLVTYDAKNLYVAFRAHDPKPADIRAHLMDRDDTDTLIQDDHVGVMIDTFNDERRAFQFRVNPLGVQADAVFSEQDGVEDFSWDMMWNAVGRITGDGYIVEMAFPLKQLRFKAGEGAQIWGFEAFRSWPRNVRHRISSQPRDRNKGCVLCQENKIAGLEGLAQGRNVELDPTATFSRTDELASPDASALTSGDPDVVSLVPPAGDARGARRRHRHRAARRSGFRAAGSGEPGATGLPEDHLQRHPRGIRDQGRRRARRGRLEDGRRRAAAVRVGARRQRASAGRDRVPGHLRREEPLRRLPRARPEARATSARTSWIATTPTRSSRTITSAS